MNDPSFNKKEVDMASFSRILLALAIAGIGVLTFMYFAYFDESTENGELEEQAPESIEETEETKDGTEDAADEEETPELSTEEMIYRYYQNLQDGKLEEAYAMKYKPEPSFATFQGWYAGVKSAEVSNLKQLNNGDHSFTVFLSHENGAKGEYRTVMREKDDLLQTVSAYEVQKDSPVLEATWGTKKATVKDDGEKQYIYLDGKLISETGKYQVYEEYKWGAVTNIYFSQNGEYLIWRLSDLESHQIVVKHLNSGNQISLSTPSVWGFTADMHSLYSCQESGFHGGHMDIYNLPSMNVAAKLDSDDGVVSECGKYDAKRNSFTYKLAYYQNDSTTLLNREYFFATREVR